MTTKKEYRIHPRLLVRMPGEFRVGQEHWQQAHLQDLSAGGATLISMKRIPPQTSLRLRFVLPGESDPPSPIEVETIVLRADTGSATGGNMQYREALHFLDLIDEKYERVRRYVFEHGETAMEAPGA